MDKPAPVLPERAKYLREKIAQCNTDTNILASTMESNRLVLLDLEDSIEAYSLLLGVVDSDDLAGWATTDDHVKAPAAVWDLAASYSPNGGSNQAPQHRRSANPEPGGAIGAPSFLLGRNAPNPQKPP